MQLASVPVVEQREHQRLGPVAAVTLATRFRHRWLGSVAVAALAAYSLRAYRLAGQSLWSDEDITLDRALLPARELVQRLPVEHGPLYFLLLHGWTRIAGPGDFALRFPSLCAGVAAVVLSAYVGARLASRRVGLYAAAIVAVNPFQVWYGQEARMYTLVEALSLLALAAVLRAEQTKRARWWVIGGLAAAAAVLTHYYAALIVAVLIAWALHARRRTGPLPRGWYIAAVAGGAAFAPWVPKAMRVLSFEGWREPMPLGSALWTNLTALSVGQTAAPRDEVLGTLAYVLFAAAGLAWLVACARAPRCGTTGAVRSVLYLAVPMLLAALLLVWTRDYHPRYYFAVIPAFYIWVAAGVALVPRRVRAASLGLVLLSAALPLARMYTDANYQKQDYRSFTRAVESEAGHEDTVLFLDGPSYGLTRRYETDDSPVKIVDLRSTRHRDRTPAELASLLSDLAADYPHLWLAEGGEAAGDARLWLSANAYPVISRAYQRIVLERYLSAVPDPVDITDNASFRCPDGRRDEREDSCGPVRLQLHARPSALPGGVVAALCLWRTDEPLTRTLKVSLRLVEVRSGRVVSAVDRLPGNGQRPSTTWPVGEPVMDRHGLEIPDALPPGDFRLLVVLYEADTNAPLGTWTGPLVRVGPAR